jgi:2-polyprenyl-6-methoxyphenol hydroxylase-like FAD-dependent oxidoreductase
MANKRLEILVIGAGPSGLAFSIELAQRWKQAQQANSNMIDLRVTIRDKRIEQVSEANSSGPMPGRRRDQIVTIQEDVLAHLSPLTKMTHAKALQRMRVWPTSRNIPIREIEDRLLFLAQTYFFRDMLVFETVNDQNWSANTSAFQIAIGADGAGSLTRQHVFGMSDMVTHGGKTRRLVLLLKCPKTNAITIEDFHLS